MTGGSNSPIRAVEFIKEIRTGSSLPVMAGGEDGNIYVVKLMGAGDGAVSNLIEHLASKLGALLGIPVLPPALIRIEASFAGQAIDQETRELLTKSAGLNLGTLYLEDAVIYNEHHAPSIDGLLKRHIFLFDLFLLNVDRTALNPNMIVHQGKLWCLDYSSAMEMRSAITGEAYREHVILRPLKKHPFYDGALAPYEFVDKLQRISEESIRDLAESIPAEWISRVYFGRSIFEARRQIAERLLHLPKHGSRLHARLNLLRVLKAETAEEAKRRTLANRKSFEEKYGRL